MPNWCWNTLKVDLKKYSDLILTENENGKKEVDFNIVIPMPKSLEIEESSQNDPDIYIYISEKLTKSLDDVKKDPRSGLIHNMFNEDWISEIHRRITQSEEYSVEEKLIQSYERGKLLVENYEKYGATTWYNWCCNNWGVKWNASDTEIIDDDTISFTTPWGPPDGWLDALTQKDVPFTLDWEEEGGDSGSYTSDGKTLEKGYYHYDLDWLRGKGIPVHIIRELYESGNARRFNQTNADEFLDNEYGLLAEKELIERLRPEFPDSENLISDRFDAWDNRECGPIVKLKNGLYLVALTPA